MRDVIDEFLNHLTVERGLSANTLFAYRNDLYQFVDFLETGLGRKRRVHTWEDVNRDMVAKYGLDLRDRTLKDSTIARKIAAIKSFFAFLVEEGRIETAPNREHGLAQGGASASEGTVGRGDQPASERNAGEKGPRRSAQTRHP